MAQCKSGDISCPCSSYEKLFPSYLVLSISSYFARLHPFTSLFAPSALLQIHQGMVQLVQVLIAFLPRLFESSMWLNFDQFRSISIRLHGCDRLRPPSPLQCQSERNPRTAWRQQGTRSDGRAVWLAQGSRRLTVRSLSPSTCFSQTQSCGEEPKGFKKVSTSSFWVLSLASLPPLPLLLSTELPLLSPDISRSNQYILSFLRFIARLYLKLI